MREFDKQLQIVFLYYMFICPYKSAMLCLSNSVKLTLIKLIKRAIKHGNQIDTA